MSCSLFFKYVRQHLASKLRFLSVTKLSNYKESNQQLFDMPRPVIYDQVCPNEIQVLLVNLEGRIAGAENSLLLLVKHLRKDFRLAVACPVQGSLAKRLTEMNIDNFALPAPPRRFFSQSTWLIHLIKVSFYIVRIVYKTKPAIIHANSFYAAIVSLPSVLLIKRKLIWHVRDAQRFRVASRICNLLCQRIIAVSNAVKDLLVSQGIKPSRIDVVYNGIDGCTYNSAHPSKSSDAPIRFANIGQFVPWKKQHLFIEAACKFIEKGGRARFILIGDDIFGRDHKYKSRLLKQIKDCQIARKITFLGWRHSMDKVWNEIDCLVHTAQPEPFGRVIVEAMARKIPVIAVNSWGPSEIIENGKTGILVKPDDADRLSNAMLKIANHGDLAVRLASGGYERVKSNFSAERTASRISEIYKQVLAD